MNIFILAGGFGSRLRNIVNKVPKPMASINNQPFLEYQIDMLKKNFTNVKIYILTYYLSEIIERYFRERKEIKIIKEKIPLGTGGAIKNAIKVLNLKKEDSILVLNGDTYFEADLNKMIFTTNSNVRILGVFQHICDRYGTLEIKNNKIVKFKEKNLNSRNNYINAGCYYFRNLRFFEDIDFNTESFSLEKAFEQYLLLNNVIEIFKYHGIFIDIGIPEDYQKMKNYIKEKYNGNR